jgi:hypothetical protein
MMVKLSSPRSSPSWRAKGRHPRLRQPQQGRAWMTGPRSGQAFVDLDDLVQSIITFRKRWVPALAGMTPWWGQSFRVSRWMTKSVSITSPKIA